METSLHRSLKDRYASGEDGRREVRIAGFRIDAIDEAGRLIEIQSGALGPLCGKLRRLLPQHRLRIVKPVVLSRRLVQTSPRGGSIRLGPTEPEARLARRHLRRSDGGGASLSPRQPGYRSPGRNDRRSPRIAAAPAGLHGHGSSPRSDPRNGHSCSRKRPVEPSCPRNVPTTRFSRQPI